ncbi:hypothetical protein [Kribbella albertanoniae]|uniref:hypothetical protein n=1 Tax=Kribbella albertanoniae TaxID=1266829 RepID=UPI001EE09FF7|nr:hypothetical protein [Kribbella albertanoniae]
MTWTGLGMGVESIAGLLVGTAGASVTRTLNMGEVAFHRSDGDEIMLHLQCPFRVLHAETMLLGSGDMLFAETDDPNEAFVRYSTVFDTRAKVLTGILKSKSPEVLGVEVGVSGRLCVRLLGDFVVEVFPDCSGRGEAWRVFRRSGGKHLGYPAGAV